MLSDVQTIVEQSKTETLNENTCEKPSEPHNSLDANYFNPTTTIHQPREEKIYLIWI